MIIHSFPNSEIQVTLSSRSIVPRTDSGRVRPTLTYGSLLRQNPEKSLKPLKIKGWGFLHEGKSKPRRGTRKRITRLGGALDVIAREKQWERCFITLTCPGSSEQAVRAFSAWSGKILHSLHNWISKKVQRFSGDSHIARLHTWELQKRGAEHLHAVYVVPRNIYSQIEKELKSWWRNLLCRISDDAGIDIFERANGRGSWRDNIDVLQTKVEKVEKSVCAYLSKYLSKQSMGVSKGFSSLRVPRPARLWGASRYLKRYLLENSPSVTFDLGMRSQNKALVAITELAESMGIIFFKESWAMGLVHRLRFFFSGNESQKDEFLSRIEDIGESLPVREFKERRIGRMTAILFRKAKRIQDSGKKRADFNKVYGDACSKALANWSLEIAQSRFDFEMMLECLIDYDEISGRSIGRVKAGQVTNKTTIQQLSLVLFPRR